ncbi:MAG: hypothetical protein Q9214_006280 [Letrouitia sp. 1 TL-2023]
MFVRPKQKQGSAKKLEKSSIKVRHSPQENQREKGQHARLHSAPSLAYRPSLELAPPIPPRPPEDPYQNTEHSITRGRKFYYERQTTNSFPSSLSPPRLDPSTPPSQQVASFDTSKAHSSPWQSSSHGVQENRYLERLISSKLDAVLTSIDGEAFSGDEREMCMATNIYPEPPSLRGGGGTAIRGVARAADKGITSAIVSINYFAKANLYANSRLPPYLPPLKL